MSVDIDCLTCSWHADGDDLPTALAIAEDHACPGARLRPGSAVEAVATSSPSTATAVATPPAPGTSAPATFSPSVDRPLVPAPVSSASGDHRTLTPAIARLFADVEWLAAGGTPLREIETAVDLTADRIRTLYRRYGRVPRPELIRSDS